MSEDDRVPPALTVSTQTHHYAVNTKSYEERKNIVETKSSMYKFQKERKAVSGKEHLIINSEEYIGCGEKGKVEVVWKCGTQECR